MSKKQRNNDEIFNSIREMDKYSLEQLITIAFLSTLMIKDANKKLNEMKKLLKLAKNYGINLTGDLNLKKAKIISKSKDGKNRYRLKDLVNEDIILEIDPRSVLDILANFASDMGFFDVQPELDALLLEYREDLRWCGNKDVADRSGEMKYSPKDNFEQFAGEQTRAETYGNLAWLSNRFAHLFEDMHKEKLFRSSFNFRDAFMRIKNYSIHGIIREKRESRAKEVILAVENDSDNKNDRNVFGQHIFIGLPRYLQPILLHFHKNELTAEERAVCTDKNDFTYDDISGKTNNPTMPLKLSEEKESLLDYLYHNIYLNKTSQTNNMRKLGWYFSHNRARNKISTFRRMPPEKVFVSKKQPVIEQKRQNIDYINEILETSGVELPEYLHRHLQAKATYSYESFAKKIRMIIRDKLHREGMSYEDIRKQIDGDFNEVFIAMSMLKPMATLSKKGVKNPDLISAVEDAYTNKDVVMNFIKENAFEFEDFLEFKHSLITEIEDSKENRQDRQELGKLQARLDELNSILEIKLRDKQATSARENKLKREIDSIRGQISSLEDEIRDSK